MSLTEKIGYALQLLSALIFLANQQPPIVHRDIKPENIFVKGKSCVLGDFGLMKRLLPVHRTEADILRASGGAVMPHQYRTPDLIAYVRGDDQITPKSDVFQLGLVLAELFTGTNPAPPPQNETDDLVLNPVEYIAGQNGGLLHTFITDMLNCDRNTRMDAAGMFDRWQTAFFNVAEAAYRYCGKIL